MPEGDTIHRTASTLHRALAGQDLVRVDGSHRAIRSSGRLLVGRKVIGVRALGKHLIVDLEGQRALRTHLGLPGSWHLYRPGERWRKDPGAARVILQTECWVAVCFSAPDVEILDEGALDRRLGHLGPSLTEEVFDTDEAMRRARRADHRRVGDLILDQRVMAGVGNVFRCEVLFLEGLHPEETIRSLGDAELRALIERARRLLQGNLSGGARITTGDPRPGRRLWVYDRDGRPCRRCGTEIRVAWLGSPPRITYWCSSCQPSPMARSLSKG